MRRICIFISELKGFKLFSTFHFDISGCTEIKFHFVMIIIIIIIIIIIEKEIFCQENNYVSFISNSFTELL